MTSERRTLDNGEEQDLLRRNWYWHDARWYASVAAEFGIEAANRLNRANVRALGRTEMRRLMKALGVDRATNVAQALELFAAGQRLYVPTSLMDAEVYPASDGSYEVRFQRCFVHENIVRADIAGAYHCAVFDRIEGWHDAWELPLAQPLPARTCALAAGQECRQRFTIR